jgi:hypothetical protein
LTALQKSVTLQIMIIKIEFYKLTGKYYSSSEVDIGNSKLWDTDFKQVIVNNQNIMIDGWQGSYYVHTRDLSIHDTDSSYKEFYMRIFSPHEFDGLRKEIPVENVEIKHAIEEYTKTNNELPDNFIGFRP